MGPSTPSRHVGVEGRPRPTCTIIGGPNGSGKSTIYDRLELPGLFLNADVIARRLNPGRPEAASLSAGRQLLATFADVIGSREPFVYETTLSSHQSIEVMRSAQRADYEVGLVFVALGSVDLHVERVADRVSRGGHDIPEAIIRRRYEAAFRRLPEAVRIADGSIILDNTSPLGPELLIQIRAGSVEVNNLDEADLLHCRIAAAVGEGLGMSIDAVFRTAKPV